MRAALALAFGGGGGGGGDTRHPVRHDTMS
jgi:hypothetical protein